MSIHDKKNTAEALKEQTLPGESRDDGQVEGISEELERAHPADGAHLLKTLSLEEQIQVLGQISPEDAAEFVSEMDRTDRQAVMSTMSRDIAADILHSMSPDDAADVLEDLDENDQQKLLRRLHKEEAAELEHLLRFDPDTAGGVMNTELTVVNQDFTADQAIKLIRSKAGEAEIPYYAYIVDDYDHLLGVVSLRDVLLAPPGRPLSKMIDNQQLVTVPFDMDKEEVGHLLRRYNFLAMPVVDRQGHILGVVTHDDVIDIVQEEAHEDMLGMVGAGHEETINTPWLRSVVLRFPWLLINIATSVLTAWIVYQFEGTIAQMAILAALMPIIASQAGNAGQQSLAVMIRQLGTESWNKEAASSAIWRESKIGMLNGLIIGSLMFFGIVVFTGKIILAGVMAVSLGLDMVVGNFLGAGIPVFLRSIGRDPAQASSIFLTTTTDTVGFFVFLTLAKIFLLS